VAILATVDDGAPHAIPVSTAVRAGARVIVLALAPSRGSLARLRADPRCAVTVVAGGDVAFTARGRASVVHESLPGAEAVASIAVAVDEVDTHADPRFAIEAGVRWRWTDAEAAARDAAVHAALAALAGDRRTGTAPRAPGG
jgi:Pyridoxamine 5'-phosphate oxidase